MANFRLKKKLDIAIVAFAFLFFICSIGLLIDDSRLFKSNNSTEQLLAVGDVFQGTNDLRRKFSNSLVWMPVKNKEIVFDGDTLFVGEDSEAEVVLTNGSKLTLNANTLVIIRTQGKDTTLDLQYGNLVGDLKDSGSLKIKSAGQTTELSGKGSRLQISQNKAGKTNVAVISGQATVKSGDQSQLLESNQAANVSGQQIEKTDAESIFLNAPNFKEWVWYKPKDRVAFHWFKTKKPMRFQFRLAKDSLMENIVLKRETNEHYATIKDENLKGQFYWQVIDAQELGSISLIYPIYLYPDVGPDLVAPADKSKLPLADNAITRAISLTWNDTNPADSFLVQVSQESDFKSILYSETAKEFQTLVPKLAKGNYFWRVKSQHPKRTTVTWSKVFQFEIGSPKDWMSLPQIGQNQNVENYKALLKFEVLESWDNRSLASLPKDNSVQYLRSGRDEPEFKWLQPVDPGTKIQIARDERFTTIVHEAPVQSNSYRWSNFKPGEYLWRLVKDDADKTVLLKGTVALQVSPPNLLPSPEIVEELPNTDALARPLKPTQLLWDKSIYAKSFELEISDDQTFKTPLREKVAINSKRVTVPKAGRYFWRVRSLDHLGRPLGRFSTPEIFDYTRKMAIDTPSSFVPTDKETLIFLPNSEIYMIFNWKRVAKAQQYRLEVAKDNEFKEIILTQTTRNASYLLQQRLPAGQLYWRIRGEDGELTSNWTDIRTFQVKYQ